MTDPTHSPVISLQSLQLHAARQALPRLAYTLTDRLLLFVSVAEGAISTSTTDSIPLNRGGSGTSFSANMVTSRQSPLRRVARGQSWGVTAQPVGSGALVGATNGHVAMAQVHSHQHSLES